MLHIIADFGIICDPESLASAAGHVNFNFAIVQLALQYCNARRCTASVFLIAAGSAPIVASYFTFYGSLHTPTVQGYIDYMYVSPLEPRQP